jgi:SH3 domain-containing protein
MLLRTISSLSIVGGLMGLAGPALAQDITTVRVVADDAAVKIRPNSRSEVMASLASGTILEVLDREGDWYWVLLHPSAHGTREAGWIRREAIELAQAGRNGASMLPPTSRELAERRKAERAEQKAQEEARKAEEKAKKDAEKARKADELSLKNAERELEKARRDFEKVSTPPADSTPRN